MAILKGGSDGAVTALQPRITEILARTASAPAYETWTAHTAGQAGQSVKLVLIDAGAEVS
jgi:hypothetical protein